MRTGRSSPGRPTRTAQTATTSRALGDAEPTTLFLVGESTRRVGSPCGLPPRVTENALSLAAGDRGQARATPRAALSGGVFAHSPRRLRRSGRLPGDVATHPTGIS